MSPSDPLPLCPYCGQTAQFLPSSASIYRGQDYGPIFVCMPCDARVGAERTTLKPLGRLANKRLRILKMRVHEHFDPLWRMSRHPQPKSDARGRAYAWLAVRMGIERKDCHIAMFDENQCLLALEILLREKPTFESLKGVAEPHVEATP